MDDTAHSGLDPFKFVITQEKCYMDLPTGQFDAGISSAEVSSSQKTLGLYQTGTNHLTQRRFSNKLTHNSHSPKYQTSSMY